MFIGFVLLLRVSLDENRAMPIPGYRLRKATLHQGVDRRAQFPFSLADRHFKQREFSGLRLRFGRLINATGKPSASKAKEWSRCLAVQAVRKGGDGRRVYRKRVIGTVEQYSDAAAVQQLAARIIAKPSSPDFRPILAMTVRRFAFEPLP
jgi:hypothetical protein